MAGGSGFLAGIASGLVMALAGGVAVSLLLPLPEVATGTDLLPVAGAGLPQAAGTGADAAAPATDPSGIAPELSKDTAAHTDGAAIPEGGAAVEAAATGPDQPATVSTGMAATDPAAVAPPVVQDAAAAPLATATSADALITPGAAASDVTAEGVSLQDMSMSGRLADPGPSDPAVAPQPVPLPALAADVAEAPALPANDAEPASAPVQAEMASAEPGMATVATDAATALEPVAETVPADSQTAASAPSLTDQSPQPAATGGQLAETPPQSGADAPTPPAEVAAELAAEPSLAPLTPLADVAAVPEAGPPLPRIGVEPGAARPAATVEANLPVAGGDAPGISLGAAGTAPAAPLAEPSPASPLTPGPVLAEAPAPGIAAPSLTDAADGLPQLIAAGSDPAAPEAAPRLAEPGTDDMADTLEPLPEKSTVFTATETENSMALPGSETAPQPGLPGDVPGVVADRLPRIGDPPVSEPAGAPAGEAALDPGLIELDPNATPQPALQRNAAVFDNPEGRPLFSVILLDTGEVDRAALTGIGFPVSIAIDPTRPDAGEAAFVYRSAGIEVLIMATGLPEGATATDLEVAFQSHFTTIPDSVGVIDLAEGGFQEDRERSQQIMPILAADGYGLITFDRGLNSASQVARRSGVKQALVFRELDADRENLTTIRRYLDRAAFKAVQEGSVVVMGHARPETLAALLEWAVEGRSANVALAPVSVAITGQ